MYKIYIPNTNMKNIFRGRINSTAVFQIDSFDDMQRYVSHFLAKGFIVIVEPLKDVSE